VTGFGPGLGMLLRQPYFAGLSSDGGSLLVGGLSSGRGACLVMGAYLLVRVVTSGCYWSGALLGALSSGWRFVL
jgi:hypothetical protein